jgi:cell division protein FtsW
VRNRPVWTAQEEDTMARKLKSDALLFSTTLVLLVIGMAWVYSASVVKGGASLVTKQGLFMAFGIVGGFAAMNTDYRRLCNRQMAIWLVGATAVVLVGVLLFGRTVGGGRRWIGWAGLGIQPSELAKLVAIFFVANVLERRLEERDAMEPAWFQASVVLVALALLIFLERDMGGGIVLLAAGFAIIFVSGLAYRWVAIAACAGVPLLTAVLLLLPHTRQRLETWMDPYADPLGKGYQTIQSYIAVGTGGVWGKGFLAGVQKMFFLPAPQNDYIFAVIAEEQGLIGATVVLLCFAVIIWRGLRVARRAPDAFGSLLAVGITALFGIPALINMGVVTNLLPAKGISLPFVSAGGSSLIVSLVAMGVLLNISQQASATAGE